MKRAARDDGDDGARAKRAKREEKCVVECVLVVVEDVELSDYDEELLFEFVMVLNELVSDDELVSASRDARTRASAATASFAFMNKMCVKLSGG